MSSVVKLLITFCICFISGSASAQNPPYFLCTVEDGAPSNEMYWVHQDKDGYIWVGCDAGLFRFNGIRFKHYTSSELTARSATGIIQSKTSGRIYAYNFNRQLFYVEQGSIHVLKNWNRVVNGLADDGNGNIWITSSDGLFKLDESTDKISIVNSEKHYSYLNGMNYTSHGISNPDGTIYYHNGNQILRSKQGKIERVLADSRFMNVTIMISRFSSQPWFMSVTGELILQYKNGSYRDYNNEELLSCLKGKKINCVFESKDGKLWIGTYSGLVLHDPRSGKTELLYDQFSFSYGIQDKEGNYWFTTLHNGLVRIPSMQVKSWQSVDDNRKTEQFSHVCTNEQTVFLGGTNGFLSTVNIRTGAIQKIRHEPLSDLGTLYFDALDNCIYLNKLSSLFIFKNGHFELVNNKARPIKAILHVPEGYFLLSSQGLYYTRSVNEPLVQKNMVDSDWYRDICKSPFSSSFYTATNSGIKEIIQSGRTYRIGSQYLKGRQIISICPDEKRNRIYAYCFDGGLYLIDETKKIKKIIQLETDIRVTQVRCYADRLYMASNKGILVLDPESNEQVLFDRFSGLASNNIRSIAFSGNNCWAAGESLQKIPLSLFRKHNVRSRILSREVLINGNKVNNRGLIELNYKDKLSLIADGISYRSNGNYQFAYRIQGYNSNWIKVPGQVEKIDFVSLPTGNISIELKLIDHAGKDSANVIVYKLYVNPPFWQRWWFYVVITLTTLMLALGSFRWRLKGIRMKQIRELERLKLENELRLTQQNVLKAQMNPHFLFNVLNSIKGYIYENDKKNAAKYLSEFSNLVRKVLELSSAQKVSLDQELETLELYIDLEAMLLQSNFKYDLVIHESIDTSAIQMPALLLQPYVENAFKHGLRHKNGPKSLEIGIQFDDQEELLTIKIADNGIGRKASALINAENRGEHQSFATSAMEKRIQLLNHERKDVVGVEIKDKFEGVEAIGTIVIIRIHVGKS
ncbi:MAG: histidine kinase [Bacteroidota bacterium]|jgi:ligand-binding sensor domain-containing protein/signal transduction histidine kinase